MANGGVLERVAGGIQKAGVSFLSGIPQIELDRRAADTALVEAQVGRIQQEAEGERLTAQKDLEFQQLSRVAFGGGPNADAALQEIFVRNPEKADELFEGLGVVDQSHREDVSRRAAAIQATPPDQRRPLILQQAAEIEARGGDAKQTLSLLDMPAEDQDNRLRIVQAAALTTQQRAAGARGGGTFKLGQSVVTKGPEGAFAFATPVLDPQGIVATQATPIAGEVVSRTMGETARERQRRDIETAGGKATAVAISDRDQSFINVGQRQADATAIIRRGLELLDIIGTGRPEEIALAAKNLFGIAGADETELNANLGKAVLSQLRSTFGAQFTQQEGERLQGLEAGFGKSTAGNIRLLQQTLRGMERDARRGIDVARRNEDEFSATEIESALEFTLTPPDDTLDPALLELMSPEERALFE